MAYSSFFFRKTIFAKTWYKMYNQEFLCNVMKSYDQSRDGCNQIGTISDHYFQGWLSYQSPDLPNQPSDFQINLSDQPSESIFQINLSNQSTQSIFSLNRRRHWLVVRHFLQTYIRRIVLLPTEVCMIQVVDLFADHPLVKVWSVSPSSTPWWWCG